MHVATYFSTMPFRVAIVSLFLSGLTGLTPRVLSSWSPTRKRMDKASLIICPGICQTLAGNTVHLRSTHARPLASSGRELRISQNGGSGAYGGTWKVRRQ